MYIIGHGRKARETYPIRSGALPLIGVARFSLSAPAAFEDGNQTIIPFDTEDYQYGAFAEIAGAPDVRINLLPGLYLTTVQFQLDTNVALNAQVVIGDGTVTQGSGGAVDVAEPPLLSISASAFLVPSDGPIDPGPPVVFGAAYCVFTGTGSNGNILAGAAILIQRFSALNGL